MKEVTSSLMEEFGALWKIKNEHKILWQTTMAIRLRCVCVKTGDSLKKARPPKWTKRLTWWAKDHSDDKDGDKDKDANEEGDAQGGAQSKQKCKAVAVRGDHKRRRGVRGDHQIGDKRPKKDDKNDDSIDKEKGDDDDGGMMEALSETWAESMPVEQDSTTDYPGVFYSWNREMRLAFRCQVGGKPEPSLPIVLENYKEDLDDHFIIAMWLDASTKRIDGTTYGELRAATAQQRGTNKANEKLWEGTQIGSNNELYVAELVDRNLTICLYNQSQPIMYIKVDRFGPLPETPPQPCKVGKDNTTLKLALKFAMPLFEGFADGSYKDKAEVVKARDEKFLREAIPRTRIIGGEPRTAAARQQRRRGGDTLAPQPQDAESSEPTDVVKRVMGLDAKKTDAHPTGGRRRTLNFPEEPPATKLKQDNDTEATTVSTATASTAKHYRPMPEAASAAVASASTGIDAARPAKTLKATASTTMKGTATSTTMKGMPTTMGDMMHALEFVGGMSSLRLKKDNYEVEPIPAGEAEIVESD
jgi:hypothetical protein